MEAPALNQGLLPVCDVLVHGSGECDQLGLGEGVLERKKPTLVKSLIGKNIISVVSGSLHNLALSADGTVYSWGCNDDGALGRSGEENVPLPIPALAETPIRAIRAGDCHSAFIDHANRLWLCGTYKDSSGHLGFPDLSKGIGSVIHKSPEPVLVSSLLPPRCRVEDVACGANHTIVLVSLVSRRSSTSGGVSTSTSFRLLSLGNDEFGQLGLGNRDDEEGMREEDTVMLKHTSRGRRHMKTKLFPRDVPWNMKIGNGVSKVFATAQTSFIKTFDGSVYACGLNNFGQLGLGTTSVYPVRAFTKIDFLSDKNIQFVSGGTVHSAARCADGHVVAWGRRDYSGCPDMGTTDIQQPTVIPGLKNVTYISCGGSHTLACDSAGSVFSWGFGGTHQLGNLPRDISMGAAGADEEPEDEQTPYLIQSKQLSEKFALSASAGAQHSVELVWTGQYTEKIPHDAFLDMVTTPSAKRKQSLILGSAKKAKNSLTE